MPMAEDPERSFTSFKQYGLRRRVNVTRVSRLQQESKWLKYRISQLEDENVKLKRDLLFTEHNLQQQTLKILNALQGRIV
jgi:hypothetical protein